MNAPGEQTTDPLDAEGRRKAVSAGMLSIILGLIGGFTSVLGVSGLIEEGEQRGVAAYLGTAVSLAVTAVLLTGAILLFRRSTAGRWMVVAGTAAAALSGLLGVIAFVYVMLQSAASNSSFAQLGVILGAVMAGVSAAVLAMAVTALILVLARPVRRWCDQGGN